ELIVSRDGDPLTALRGAMARYARRPGGPGLPRVSGGAVGYVGYEAARYFERLPVAARDPHGLPDAVFGIYDTVVAFDHLRHTLTVLAHDDASAPGAAAQTIDRVFAALDAPLPAFASTATQPQVAANGPPAEYE